MGRYRTAKRPARGRRSRMVALVGHEIDQVVNMERVSAGEQACRTRLKIVVNDGAARHGVERHARVGRKRIFGNKAHGKQQRVTWNAALGAQNRRVTVIDLAHDDSLKLRGAFNAHDRRRRMQRNAEIIEALHDIASQTARRGVDLEHAGHARAREREAARHDEADVARTKDHHIAARSTALQVHEVLRRPGREHARRARARRSERASAAFARARHKHRRARRNGLLALRRHDFHRNVARAFAAVFHAQHARIANDVHIEALERRELARSVFGTGEFLAKTVQAEAIVDALLQNAALVAFAIDEHHTRAFARSRSSRGDARRAAADNSNVVFERGARGD